VGRLSSAIIYSASLRRWQTTVWVVWFQQFQDLNHGLRCRQPGCTPLAGLRLMRARARRVPQSTSSPQKHGTVQPDAWGGIGIRAAGALIWLLTSEFAGTLEMADALP
jgi:hypothetical protein